MLQHLHYQGFGLGWCLVVRLGEELSFSHVIIPLFSVPVTESSHLKGVPKFFCKID